MNDKAIKGILGEDYTVKYLKRHFYKIIARNYRRPFGEIDIIAIKNKYLVFVEVKTRKEGSLVSGVEAVNSDKKRRIINTAECFIKENFSHTEVLPLQQRFDISEVIISDDEKMKIKGFNYHINAFGENDIKNFKFKNKGR